MTAVWQRLAHVAAADRGLQCFAGRLFAPSSIAVPIKSIDVISDDSYRTRHIGRTVTATASTVDITRNRNAGIRVVGVATAALCLRYGCDFGAYKLHK
jgi:hypothetical protein